MLMMEGQCSLLWVIAVCFPINLIPGHWLCLQPLVAGSICVIIALLVGKSSATKKEKS